jgi:hypothetical protein
MTVKWFEDPNGRTVLSDSATLITNHLRKPVIYFVCATSPNGCKTDLKSVAIDVKPLLAMDKVDAATLDVKTIWSNDTLNSFTGTTDNNNQLFKPPIQDGYLYSQLYDACISIDSLITLNALKIDARGISMYPNPVTESFTIRSASSSISGVSILDSNGLHVSPQEFLSLPESNYSRRVNCMKLRDGIYFALIRLMNEVRCVRFVKSGDTHEEN